MYDPANAEILTIEVAGELPFQAHKLSIREHVAPENKPVAAERVEVDHSRLLDAAAKAKQKRDLTRNRAISYMPAILDFSDKIHRLFPGQYTLSVALHLSNSFCSAGRRNRTFYKFI